MNGKIKLFTLLIIFLLIYLISGCIFNNNDNGKDQDELIYNINFNGVNSNQNNYLIIPFPTHRDYPNRTNDKILEMLNDINTNYQIELTTYGIGINISFNTTIDIQLKGRPNNDMFFYELSLLNDTILFDEGYYWIYSTINGTIDYKYKISDESLEHYYRITGEIKEGWQIIKATVWKHDID